MKDSNDLKSELPVSLAQWAVCPKCKGALEPEQHEVALKPHLVCRGSCSTHWFANPKPTANVLIERADDSRLLLVKRGIDPFKGYWDIPGGFIEEGEQAENAAIREAFEETGLKVYLQEFVGTFCDVYGDQTHIQTLNLVWRAICDKPDEAKPMSDVAELAWFEREELPNEDELAFCCVKDVVDVWRSRGTK